MTSRIGEMRLLLVFLLVSGMAAWWLSFRNYPEVDPASLNALSSSLGGWQAADIEIDQAVAEMLNADLNVQRAYSHRQGYTVFVYVGYYGRQRGGTPEHTPDTCYPSQGWTILDSIDRRIGGQKGFDVREFILSKGDARRLVHFWYQTSTATGITSTFGLRINHFWSRLTNSGGDGALIRLSTPYSNSDLGPARDRLSSLDLQVKDELDRVWPHPFIQQQNSPKSKGVP